MTGPQSTSDVASPPSAGRAGELSALRRGIDILRILEQSAHTEEPALGNNRIATILGADKSQTSRTLRVLIDAGLVVRDEATRTYSLGGAASSIGLRAADQELMRCGARVIDEIVRVTGFRAYLVVRRGASALTLWSEQPAGQTPVVNSMGMQYPIHSSETGRALMAGAYDHEIRHVLTDDDERDIEDFIRRVHRDRSEGFSWRQGGGLEDGIAVPVWTTGRRVAAAIGVADVTLSDRVTALRAARVITAAAADLTQKITREDRRAVQAVPYMGWPHAPAAIFGPP